MALLSVNQNVEPRNYPSHAELIQQVEYLNSPSLLRIRNGTYIIFFIFRIYKLVIDSTNIIIIT